MNWLKSSPFFIQRLKTRQRSARPRRTRENRRLRHV
jgi:hypothetical protein